jgi:hypothetical protein
MCHMYTQVFHYSRISNSMQEIHDIKENRFIFYLIINNKTANERLNSYFTNESTINTLFN